MTVLAREVRLVQNAALGAGLVWRFASGYRQAHPTRDAPPIILAYVVLPLLYHAETQVLVKGTQRRSGLRTFTAKFSESENPRQDILLGLQNRSIRLRSLTTESLAIAMKKGLVGLANDGRLLPLSLTEPVAGLSSEARQLMRDAEKVGAWFAPLTLHEVATILKLRF